MLGWLRRHGLYTGPRLEMDSLRMVQDSMERLQPRGKGPDPLADRYPAGRDVVQPLQITGTHAAPDLIHDLQDRLRKEHP